MDEPIEQMLEQEQLPSPFTPAQIKLMKRDLDAVVVQSRAERWTKEQTHAAVVHTTVVWGVRAARLYAWRLHEEHAEKIKALEARVAALEQPPVKVVSLR